MRETIEGWCEGRFWPVRAVLLAWVVYIGGRHLNDPDYSSLFGGLNLAVHEAGHLLFRWSGSEFLTVAGGTILQLAAPIGSALMFIRQPDYFAVCICGGWLATNLYNVATYVADARELVLPLVTVGDGECIEICHDWHYLLLNMNLLTLDTTIAKWIRIFAFLVLWGSIAGGAWMVWVMAKRRT